MTEDFLRRSYAAILRFFKDRKPTEIRVRKQQLPIKSGQPSTLFVKDRARLWPRHGMPKSHNVDARHALPYVGMHALKITQNRFFPVIPVFVDQQLAIGSR